MEIFAGTFFHINLIGMKRQSDLPEDKKPGSDASGLNLKEVFSDVGQKLKDTDPDQLAMPPVEERDRTEHATKPLMHTEPDQHPGIYHDNIYDPADISKHQSGVARGAVIGPDTNAEADKNATIDGLQQLHEKAQKNAEKTDQEDPNDDLLLNSHTYL